MESCECLDKEWASGFRRRKFVLLEPMLASFLLCEGIDVRLYFMMCEDKCVMWYKCGDQLYKVMGSLGWCRKHSTR